MKPRLLCILHRSPPKHGAAKVGDFISESKELQKEFNCQFITIKSSETIGDIGKINSKKLYLVVELYIKVFISLLFFRPDKIYFTASIKSIAFYRDILLSTLWKCYKLLKKVSIYYHYHTKGVDEFVSLSKKNLRLTDFFVKDINLILLSPLLKKDFERVTGYKSISYLPNGIESSLNYNSFNNYVDMKYENSTTIHILYLAHMIKEKGYWSILELAKSREDNNIHYHFAGAWKNREDKEDFFLFIKKHNLEKKITYHGFVSGEEKENLFKQANILLYPSKNEAFGLAIIESLSYGVPIIATDEGSIPFILDNKSGIVIDNIKQLPQALEEGIKNFNTIETAHYCRERYLKNFTLKKFEFTLLEKLK